MTPRSPHGSRRWWWPSCVVGACVSVAVCLGVVTEVVWRHSWWSTYSTATDTYRFSPGSPVVGVLNEDRATRVVPQGAPRGASPSVVVRRSCLLATPVTFRDQWTLDVDDQEAFPGITKTPAVQVDAAPWWAGCRTSVELNYPPETGALVQEHGATYPLWSEDRARAW